MIDVPESLRAASHDLEDRSLQASAPTRLPEWALRLLRCPVCRAELARGDEQLRCTNAACGAVYPLIQGIPVLINEGASLFSIGDFVDRRSTYFQPESRLQRRLKRLIPRISQNVRGERNYEAFAGLALRAADHPRVLVIGGSILGDGMRKLLEHPAIELVESDIAFGPRVTLLSDAHDIPFESDSFDGVVVQAVLQHVVDPYRCVAEIHRVLKAGGLVYAETPFMQQIHGGRYDFTRFTHLGHRRLFRSFAEVESGAVCGPGMALAWSYLYFLLSFVKRKPARALVRLFVGLTAFYLKYIDRYLIDKPGALDAASGYYFLGRKSDRILPDRELIKLYRGVD